MPYASNEDLPAGVARGLSDAEKSQYRAIFNKCHASGKDEAACFKLANGVIKGSSKELVGDVVEVANAETGEKGYQYVGSWEYESRAYTQQEADYSAVGGGSEKACSNCRFFIAPSRCTLVSGLIAPNGISDLWAAVPPPAEYVMPVRIVKDDASELEEAIAAAIDDPTTTLPGNSDSKPEVGQEPVSAVSTIVQRVKGLFDSIIARRLSSLATQGRVQYGDGLEKAFSIKEMPDGSLRWFSRMSNNFKDRQGETITEAAHLEFIEWADKSAAYPELWTWHIPGSRFGQTDFVEYDSGFVCASGTIDNNAESLALAKSLSESQEDLGVSHGFVCLKTKDGTITKYRSYELSVLPLVNAANGWTGFDLLAEHRDKENEMAFNEAKRKFLEQKGIPTETISAWESSNETFQKALTERGVQYKSMMEDEAGEVDFAAEVVNQSKAVGDFVASVSEQVKSLSEQVIALEAKVTKSRDEIVAEEFKARATPGAGFAASTDAATVTQTKENAGASGVDISWMNETIFKDITPSVPRS